MDHKPWHTGSYPARAKRIVAAANANPATQCWRCKRTIAEVRKVKPKAIWTAGHLVDGQVDGPLAAECSPCNYGHGARRGNQLRAEGIRLGQPPPTVTW